jgi:hypothetical protein
LPPGVDRCQLTCEEPTDCDAGTVCSGGFCIEGVIPPAACVGGLQRYSLHASDAFVAIGDRTGYLHDVIEGAGGQCVRDPASNPLVVGRIPLAVPACTGDGVTDVTPNPCLTTVEHTELVPNYMPGTCTPQNEISVLRTVTAQAIRFRNPLMTIHIVDPAYPGDVMCRNDRLGTRVGIPVVFPSFYFQFRLIAGFSPLNAGGLAVLPSRIVKSPDGVLWIVDEGDGDPGAIDVPDSSANWRGQIIRVDPDVVTAGTVVR